MKEKSDRQTEGQRERILQEGEREVMDDFTLSWS